MFNSHQPSSTVGCGGAQQLDGGAMLRLRRRRSSQSAEIEQEEAYSWPCSVSGAYTYLQYLFICHVCISGMYECLGRFFWGGCLLFYSTGSSSTTVAPGAV